MAQRTTTEDRISAGLGSVYTNLGNRFRTLRGESAVNSEPIPAVTPAPAPAHSLASVANGGIATSTPRTTPEDRVSSAVKSGYSNLNNRFTVLRGEQPTVATLSQAENPAGSTSPPRQREVRGKLQPDGSRLVIDQRPVSMTPTVPVPNLAPATATPQRDGIQSANLTPEDQSSFVNATVDANQIAAVETVRCSAGSRDGARFRVDPQRADRGGRIHRREWQRLHAGPRWKSYPAHNRQAGKRAAGTGKSGRGPAGRQHGCHLRPGDHSRAKTGILDRSGQT